MIWEEIRSLYLKATGNTPEAGDSAFMHLTEGYRELLAKLDLPELHQPNATFSTVASQDWVALDNDVFSIDSVIDQTTGQKLTREPSGFKGRMRYYESGETRPPTGTPSFWVRSGTKIFMRPTPIDIRTMVVSFRVHAPEVDADLLDNHPLSPPQFDMALVRLAAASFFTLIPPIRPDGATDYQRAEQLRSAAFGQLQSHDDPVADEDRDSVGFIRTPGYILGVSGR